MLISSQLNKAFNTHLGRELFASHQYVNMAAYFDGMALKMLAKMFFQQADEERAHAQKFVEYIGLAGGKVELPTVDAPKASFGSVEEAVQDSLNYEMEVTRQINALMDQAVHEKDYAAQDFLRYFVTEQLEEVETMENMLRVVKMAGERNIYMVEAYLVHQV